MITAIVLSIIIPILVLTLLPRIVTRLGGKSQNYQPWLVAACLVYVVSWWLPSPFIEGRDTSFTTHLLGGGMFTGMLWYYLKQSFNWHAHWVLELFSLFALVSALGVANELFEVVLYVFHGMPHGITDTSWDLLANTVGALLFYVAYLLQPAKYRDRK